MRAQYNSVTLASLGVLRVRGADALSFLQGQLSNDLTLLGAQRSLLAGYHNPQGRVIALLRLLQLAPDDVLALLPRELIAVVAQRLARFILRAKVKLADESAQWTVTGLMGAPASDPAALLEQRPAAPRSDGLQRPSAPLAEALPADVNGAARSEASLAVRVAGQPARWLLLSGAAQAHACAGASELPGLTWQRLVVAAGEPQVYAATSEQFVAQMLNLDVIGAIDFDKGCYTGQEVIARAHYRGRVKRRLQRFLTRGAAQLQPGDTGELTDGRAFKVVDAVPCADGRCEFLAVATLPGEAGEGNRSAPAEGARRLDAEQLELPYAIPA